MLDLVFYGFFGRREDGKFLAPAFPGAKWAPTLGSQCVPWPLERPFGAPFFLQKNAPNGHFFGLWGALGAFSGAMCVQVSKTLLSGTDFW